MGDIEITKIWARQVLDSRGNPTVEAEVFTRSVKARAIAPSGASTGTYEALELRDGGDSYMGKGVEKAVINVRGPIAETLVGMDVTDQKALDRAMVELDGTPNKSSLGGNATTAVSMACAHAGAMVKGVELHEHLGPGSRALPVPMLNIINGGKHAGSDLKIQEFMIAPTGARNFTEAMRMAAEVYHKLKSILSKRYGKGAINVGDEGGFAPPLDSAPEALEVIGSAIEAAGYIPGRDILMALDSAASEFFSDGVYSVDGMALDRAGIIDYYADLVERFPIVSLEDPVEEEAFDTMSNMTARLGDVVQLVGDDLFVTNPERVKMAIEQGAGNALLLKVNQIGTISEAFEAARLSFESGYNVVVSHRSGETEDTTIADIVVALESGQIKTGAPARGERTAKYNRLMRIEEMLGSRAVYPGLDAFTQKPYRP
jgi:enolase